MSPRTITASSMTEITSVIIRTWLLGMFFIFPPGIRGSQLACTRKCIKNPSACRTAHMRITAFKSTLKDEPAPHCHRSVWQEASEGGGYGGCNGGGGVLQTHKFIGTWQWLRGVEMSHEAAGLRRRYVETWHTCSQCRHWNDWQQDWKTWSLEASTQKHVSIGNICIDFDSYFVQTWLFYVEVFFIIFFLKEIEVNAFIIITVENRGGVMLTWKNLHTFF